MPPADESTGCSNGIEQQHKPTTMPPADESTGCSNSIEQQHKPATMPPTDESTGCSNGIEQQHKPATMPPTDESTGCSNGIEQQHMKKILVIGAGYVGQITAVGLAEIGHSVVNVDINSDIIAGLHKARSHLYEKGLQELIKKNINAGRIIFSTELAPHISHAELVYIAVGTPVSADGVVNMQFVMHAIHEIKHTINPRAIIITKSTVPVGTNQKIIEIIKSLARNKEVSVISNPEFLQEGRAVEDFFSPSRILIGYVDERIIPVMKDVYDYFQKKEVLFIWSGLETAELAKYVSNAFLATRVALINQFAQVAEQCGAHIDAISQLLQSDSRLGSVLLRPGPGFGGSCLPKDCRSLIHLGKQVNAPFTIIEEVLKANRNHQVRIVQKVQAVFEDMENKKIVVLGLAFKAHTNDVRDSAALPVLNKLLHYNTHIIAHDPQAIDNFKSYFHDDRIEYITDIYEATKGADAIIILTEWPEYTALDYEVIYRSMRRPLILDARNILDSRSIREMGFEYYQIGA